jgi:antimicrobial peptide system SdpA family protein
MILIVASNFKNTTIFVSKKYQFYITVLFPQGWCFFTKNPMESRIFIYEYTSKGLHQIERWPNSSPNNFWGFNKTARAIGTDYGLLDKTIADSLWIHSNLVDIEKELVCKSNSIICKYPDNYPHFLYGNLLFVKRSLLPWAWSNTKIQIKQPLKFIRVNVIK